MKSLLLSSLIIILSAGMVTIPASASDSSMKGFQLKNCSADAKECVLVQAQTTEGSQLRPIQKLDKPSVTLISKNKKTVLLADSGYVDLSENQVVIYQKKSHQVIEIAINLNTFKRTQTAYGDL